MVGMVLTTEMFQTTTDIAIFLSFVNIMHCLRKKEKELEKVEEEEVLNA